MLLAHKVALDPNPTQRMYLARAAGVARVAYNSAAAEWQAQHKAGGEPSEIALNRQLNAIGPEQFAPLGRYIRPLGLTRRTRSMFRPRPPRR